jgi:hypothetical protein
MDPLADHLVREKLLQQNTPKPGSGTALAAAYTQRITTVESQSGLPVRITLRLPKELSEVEATLASELAAATTTSRASFNVTANVVIEDDKPNYLYRVTCGTYSQAFRHYQGCLHCVDSSVAEATDDAVLTIAVCEADGIDDGDSCAAVSRIAELVIATRGVGPDADPAKLLPASLRALESLCENLANAS